MWVSAFAQGGQDYPLFPKLNNYQIVNYESGRDVLTIPVSDIESVMIEGQKTFINYTFGSSGLHPNYRQLVQNYQDMVRENGGKLVFTEKNYGIYNLTKNTGDVWLIVEGYNDGREYSITVVEAETALDDTQDLLRELMSGNITLYINFESGKSDLPSDAIGELQRISKLMKKFPRFVISIEGHTDNVGSAADNKKLSEARANAVLKELVSEGVAETRMYAVGWGVEKPVASNDSEDGRRQNRRVEIVKVN